MKANKRVVTVLCSLLLVLCCITTAFAETSLPDGAVKGLPERLAALDDEGNAVNSATGEYFFHVENMQFGEVYTKDVQLINLREDATYHIYFYAEPLFKAGEIDLETGCECRFFLDGKEFYKGTVNGDGNFDMTQQHFDCGTYAPGETHTLRAEVVWNNFQTDKTVDNGWRMVDKDGEHVLVNASGTGAIEGEIEFKWIFYAHVDESPATSDQTPVKPGEDNAPQTGILFRNGTFWLICIGVIAAAVLVLLVLIVRNKKKEKDEEKNG